MSHKIPPWSVPMGFACCAVASSSMTAWPGCMAVNVKPISLATGGGESSPRYICYSGHSLLLPLRRRHSRPPGISLHSPGDDYGVDHKSHSDGGKKARQAAFIPVHDHPAPACRNDEPHAASQEGPQQPPSALRSKVQGQPEPETAIGWSNDPEIHGPDCQNVGVRTEESEPEVWETSAEESNAACDCGCESCTHPGHAPRTCQAARADVRPDHGDECRAKAKDERNLQIFQTRAYAIAGEGEGAEGTDETGQEHDIEVGEHRVERTGQADAQDFPEERPLPVHLSERQPHQTAAREQIRE